MSDPKQKSDVPYVDPNLVCSNGKCILLIHYDKRCNSKCMHEMVSAEGGDKIMMISPSGIPVFYPAGGPGKIFGLGTNNG